MSGNSSSSDLHFIGDCREFQTVFWLSIAFMVCKFFTTVPFSIVILAMGYRRWQRQRSFQTTSHSDIFTYNAAGFGLIFGLVVIFYYCGFGTHVSWLMTVGVYVSHIAFPGEILLHILTCVEHYLAVVYPVIYLGLRQTSGVRIRNISIGCVWLLSFAWLGVIAYFYPGFPVPAYLCLLTTSLVIVSFCNLSVLCVLIRRGPGKTGGLRERADKSKKKAFYTITAIGSVLVAYFLATIFGLSVKNSNLLDEGDKCLALMCAQWFGFPSHLVLPLLFLQRAKEVQCSYCCKT